MNPDATAFQLRSVAALVELVARELQGTWPAAPPAIAFEDERDDGIAFDHWHECLERQRLAELATLRKRAAFIAPVHA